MAKVKRVAERKELSTGYYLANFESLIEQVQSIYGDLLQKSHKEFLQNFNATSENGKRLFVRLSMRTHDFFRQEKLNYPEISLDEAVEELSKNGLIEVNPYVEFPDLWRPFTVKELKDFYLKLKGERVKVSKREEVLDCLTPMKNEEEKFYEEVFSQGNLIWPLYQDEWSQLKLMFFGSTSQDMEQFILEDLGIMRFGPIEIDKTTRAFNKWSEIETYYLWNSFHHELWQYCFDEDYIEATKVFKKIQKLSFQGKFLETRYSRSLNMMAKNFEKIGEDKRACRLYEQSILPPARERLTRLYFKERKFNKAFQICDQILESPSNEAERYFAEFFIEKVRKAQGHDYKKKKRLASPVETLLPIQWDKNQGVENQVLHFLEKKRNQRGFFSENNYFPTLALLLFWEEYWQSDVGVFYHPFERGPRDFLSGEFYWRQKEALGKKVEFWRSLKKSEFKKEVLDVFDKAQWTTCLMTSWKKVEKKNIRLILSYMERDHLLLVSEQILKDPKQYCSGFPDLFLIDEAKKCYLAEVKSPNDSLQASQKKWMDKFTLWGLPFCLYRVS